MINNFEELVLYLLKEMRSQSMSEEFSDGYSCAIYEIRKFARFTDEQNAEINRKLQIIQAKQKEMSKFFKKP